MAQNVSLAEVEDRLSEFVERVEQKHDRVVITRHGRPAAFIVSVNDLESLEETLAILSDANIMSYVAAAREDAPADHVERVTYEELLADRDVAWKDIPR